MEITTKTSRGKRLINSVFGIFVGIVMFFGAFVVLFNNEGTENLSKVAVDATLVTAEEPGEIAE